MKPMTREDDFYTYTLGHFDGEEFVGVYSGMASLMKSYFNKEFRYAYQRFSWKRKSSLC